MNSAALRKPLLATLLSALLIAPLFTLLPGDAHAQARKLRIGVEGAYPPFSEVGADGKIKGFDIDIANALCAEIKAECTLVTLDFDGMIPSLNSRKIDAVVASMSITEERAKAVDFTDKYYSAPNHLVAKTGSLKDASLESLKGKKIGVQRSTVHDTFASKVLIQSTIVRYTKQSEAFLDLAAGRIDAALLDSAAADYGFLRTPQGKGFGFIGASFEDPKFFGTGVGIAVRKGDKLREDLNRGIAAIRSNGTYKKIQDKYFNFDIYGAAPAKK